MNLAYIILAHCNPKQLLRLIQSLEYPNDYFFIHIDKKVNDSPFKDALNRSTANFSFVQKRENGRWGDIGIVNATLNCMREVVRHKTDFDHIVLLSGQDYPIKPISIIRNFFSSNLGKTFIEYQKFPVKELDYHGLNRTECYSFNIGHRRETYIPPKWKSSFNTKRKILNFILGFICLFLPKRKFPNNWTPYYGSQWWSMPRDVFTKVIKYIDKDESYLKYHSYSLIPDELFFQSIVLNIIENKEWIINDNYRYIVWQEENNSPNILTTSDLPNMKISTALFARKFDSEKDTKILDLIDSDLS
jgi:hypothetical protein